MKKNFMTLFASALLVGFTFASCGSDNDEAKNDGEGPNKGGDTGGYVMSDDAKASLEGSDYFVFQMDDATFLGLKEAGKIKADLRIDGAYAGEGEDPDPEIDKKIKMDIWENTMTGMPGTDINFYGQDNLIRLQIAGNDWYGGGYNTPANRLPDAFKLKEIDTNPADYYLHIAIKSNDKGDCSHRIILTYGNILDENGNMMQGEGVANSGVVVLGNKAIDGRTPYKDFARDGEWTSINIPISKFYQSGDKQATFGYNIPDWQTNADGTNPCIYFFSFSGPNAQAGKSLIFDAVFIYKKKK